MADHTEQVWLITGASRGIGRACAETMLKNGRKVAATARNPKDLDALVDEFGDNVLALEHDVNKPEHNERAVAETVNKFGRLDALLNNAGYGLQGVVEEVTMDQVRHQMETNFFGLTHLTQLALSHMRRQQSGYIFNIASVAGLRGFGGLSIYNASKFAVVGMTEGLAQEVKPLGINAVAVEPGPYRTDWAGDSLIKSESMEKQPEDSPYAHLNSRVDGNLRKVDRKQPGDPYQIAEVLMSAATKDELPVHMLMGDEAKDMWENQLETYQKTSFFDIFPHDRRSV